MESLSPDFIDRELRELRNILLDEIQENGDKISVLARISYKDETGLHIHIRVSEVFDTGVSFVKDIRSHVGGE